MKVTDQMLLAQLTPPITSQQQWLQRLQKQGVQLTQASLSRRLKKLGIQKVDGVYQQVSLRPQAKLASTVVAATPVPPNLVLLRTQPGYANSIAAELDNVGVAGVAGTLAGDDTVLIVVQAPYQPQAIITRLARWLPIR